MDRPHCQVAGKPAITLVEVLVALAVTAIALLALLRLHLVSVRLGQRAELEARALMLAQQKIAQTVAAGYPPVGQSHGQVELDGTVFDWYLRLTDLAPVELAALQLEPLREIHAEVSWSRTGSSRQKITLSRWLADPNL